MNIRRAGSLGLVLGLMLLCAIPASAGGFSLFGSYIDLDAPDGAAGAGLRFDMDLGSSWTFDVTASYHDRSDLLIDTDLLTIDIVEGIRFIPLDVGVRYYFGDSDDLAVYVGGGGSLLQIDAKISGAKEEFGFYGIVGLNFGDDIGPKFFVEGLYRAYGDVQVDLFEELASNNRAEFNLDGFSAAVGVRWNFGR